MYIQCLALSFFFSVTVAWKHVIFSTSQAAFTSGGIFVILILGVLLPNVYGLKNYLLCLQNLCRVKFRFSLVYHPHLYSLIFFLMWYMKYHSIYFKTFSYCLFLYTVNSFFIFHAINFIYYRLSDHICNSFWWDHSNFCTIFFQHFFTFWQFLTSTIIFLVLSLVADIEIFFSVEAIMGSLP